MRIKMKKKWILSGLTMILAFGLAGCGLKIHTASVRTQEAADTTINNKDIDEDKIYGSNNETDGGDIESNALSRDEKSAEQLEKAINDFLDDIVKENDEDSSIIKDIDEITSDYIDLSKLNIYFDNEFLEELEDYLEEEKLSMECEDDKMYFELNIYGDYKYGYMAFVNVYYK